MLTYEDVEFAHRKIKQLKEAANFRVQFKVAFIDTLETMLELQTEAQSAAELLDLMIPEPYE